MTYTPKPGDRVTSPLLVGEWEVSTQWEHQPSGVVRLLDEHRDAIVYLWPDALVPVAPPLPPEPAVGSVVRANTMTWLRTEDRWRTGHGSYCQWSSLCRFDDLSPVVAVEDVAEWMKAGGSCCGDEQVRDLRDEFGGWPG